MYNTQEIEDIITTLVGVMSDTDVKRIKVKLVLVFEKDIVTVESSETISIDKEVAGINFG